MMSKLGRTVYLHTIMLITVAVFSADAYLPSLPPMTHALNASHQAVKLTISLYLLGMGLAPLIFGPLSDRFGRRIILLSGLLLAMIGSVLCLLAPNIHWVIIGRLIQGTGISGGMSLGRAMGRDVFTGKELAKLSSYMGMIIGSVPAIAPTIGGYIQSFFGWRGTFVLIFILICLCFFSVLLYLPETNKNLEACAIHPRAMFRNYKKLICDKAFIIYPCCMALSFSGIMAYMAISPFLFQTILKLSPIQYGWLAAIIGGGIIAGSFINSQCMIPRFSSETNLLIGSLIMLTASSALLLFGLVGWLNIPIIMLPMFLYMIGSQFMFSNAFSLGMSRITGLAGIAAALFSSIQMGGSAIATGVSALFHIQNQNPLGLIMLIISLTNATMIYCWVFRKRSAEPIQQKDEQTVNH